MDYSTRIRCGEEVVQGVIEDVLTEGGHMLWQKYLQRKAFPFAAETATDVLVSQLRLCFVAHDRGEPEDTTDPEDWDLEPEPVPAEVDNWARMQLTVRRKQKKFGNDLSPASRPERRLQTMRTRVSEARARAKSGSGREKSESKSFDLKQEVQLDDAEEQLRDARQQEETKRRDRENKVRQNEKAQEEEQRRVQALHEEMSKKNHTFDSEGGLIWVEELKLDRLPKVQEVVPYFVKKDPRAKGPENDAASGKGKESPAGKKTLQRTKKRVGTTSRSKMDEDDFPDGFSKLQHGQPPILETMLVKPGVVLDVHGKSKAGPTQGDKTGGMSRKEYVALTEKEVAYEAQFASMSDPSAEHGGEPNSPGMDWAPPGTAGSRPPGTAGSRGVAGLGDVSADGGSGPNGETLPPIGGGGLNGTAGSAQGRRVGTAQGSRASNATAKADDPGSKNKADVQKAPPAPPMSVRSRKMQSIGHLGQPPRLHVAPLGGPYGFGVAQPPLGATMGHGLVRHGSAKESYFFPHSSPEMPSLLRATSDVVVGPKGRGQRLALPLSRGGSREDLGGRSQTAPSKGDYETGAIRDDEESPRHGMIRVDKKSQAYRGMRQTLFPNNLSSGYVAGMA